jgi:hypothetical protein
MEEPANPRGLESLAAFGSPGATWEEGHRVEELRHCG